MTEPDRRTAHGALLLILCLAATLRLLGIGWGGGNSLHPDERFLTMVAADLEANDELLDYFDTAESTLNPSNVGSRRPFVYGTYPVLLVRSLAEATGWTWLVGLRTMGRLVSTVWDLLTIATVFVLGSRLADRRTGLLAAFFLAVTVLHIQHSHFFTVDLPQTFFVTLALTIAVGICRGPETKADPGSTVIGARLNAARFGSGLLFGIAAAAAVAAKLSAAPVVLLLPAAHVLRVLRVDRQRRRREILPALGSLVVAGSAFALAFRVLQPYAFAGPGFFDLRLDPRWTDAIDGLRRLSGPDADWPPAMQWARRTVLFSGRNMVCWGFGLPLGLLAAAGTTVAARRARRRFTEPMTLAVAWVVGVFVWQSLQANPTMRYQLPIYPTLAFFAAWLVVAAASAEGVPDAPSIRQRIATAAGAVVALTTLVYAIAFTGIYLRPDTREVASRWIYENVPGPVNLHLDAGPDSSRQPVGVDEGRHLAAGRPLEIDTCSATAGRLHGLDLPRLLVDSGTSEPELHPAFPGITAIVAVEGGAGVTSSGLCAPIEPRVSACTADFGEPLAVAAGDTLVIRLELIADAGTSAVPVGGAIANESSWDQTLPLRLDCLEPFAGIYRTDLKLELYRNADAAKRERMLHILNTAEIIAISSHRQWATLPRIPERFPLVTTYYRHLVGCPPEQSVISCFIAAEPGSVAGDLGFELVAVFTSFPRIGPIAINDLTADEAFTVYDHPKVLLFRKSSDFDPAHLREVFESVDLDQVQLKPPRRF